jgi:hypothetical protein
VAMLDLDKRVLRGLRVLERVMAARSVGVTLVLLVLAIRAVVLGRWLGRLGRQSGRAGSLCKLWLVVLARLRSVQQVQQI